MKIYTLLFALLSLFSFNHLFAQSNCGTAVAVDPCTDSATEYDIAGDDSAFNLSGCSLDGDDAIWISFTVETEATEVTITLSEWGGCGTFCATDITGAFYSGTCSGSLTAIDDCIDMTTGFTNGTNLGPWTFPVTLNETYYFRLSEEDDQGGFAELEFEYDDCSEPLPVELVSFEGEATEEGNLITWKTAIEEDTEFHIIERSNDGRNDWGEVGRVDAVGFSADLQEYEWMDRSAAPQSYYRLMTLDWSGLISYSPVISIERELVVNSLDKVYPNPTTSNITVQYSTPKSENVTLAIYDMRGKLLRMEEQSSEAGANEWYYDMSELVDGMYIVRLITPVDQFNKKVVLKRRP